MAQHKFPVHSSVCSKQVNMIPLQHLLFKNPGYVSVELISARKVKSRIPIKGAKSRGYLLKS